MTLPATPDDMNYIERVEHYREDVHGELTETYEYLLGQGCSPRQAAGTLRYLAGQLGHGALISQSDAGAEYGLSGPTLRKWAREAWREHTGEAWDGPVDSSKSPNAAARDIHHTLYHSEKPLLPTPDLIDRVDYPYETIGIALRALENTGAVGGRLRSVGATGGAKEWWVVARDDTPDHEKGVSR